MNCATQFSTYPILPLILPHSKNSILVAPHLIYLPLQITLKSFLKCAVPIKSMNNKSSNQTKSTYFPERLLPWTIDFVVQMSNFSLATASISWHLPRPGHTQIIALIWGLGIQYRYLYVQSETCPLCFTHFSSFCTWCSSTPGDKPFPAPQAGVIPPASADISLSAFTLFHLLSSLSSESCLYSYLVLDKKLMFNKDLVWMDKYVTV
jgi:hypothetical protein